MSFTEGRNVKVGYAEQATWGTAIADSGTFTQISTEAVEVDRDIKTIEASASSGGRQLTYQDRFIHTNGSMPRFVTKGPASRQEMDMFLYSFFQDVIEGLTPFTKNFSYFDTQPDFSSNEGKFLTWLIQYPDASTSWKMKNCIAEKIKLECERDGTLMMEVAWVSSEAAQIDANPNATATWERGLDDVGGSDNVGDAYGLLFFNDLDIVTVNFNAAGATTPVLQSFSIELEHTVEGVGPGGSGGYTNIGIKDYKSTFEMNFLKGAQFETALSNQEANGYVQANLNWGAATAVVAGELELILTGKLTESPTVNLEGLISGSFKAESLAASASADSVLINMTNLVDRTWPSS